VVPRIAGSLVLGAVVGALGTVEHRSVPPWGLVLVLLLVLAGAVTVRAWGGLVALLAYAVAWGAVVFALSMRGPGGDVLIPGGTASWTVLGQVWILGAWVPIAASAFLPSRWFQDAQLPRPEVGPVIVAGAEAREDDGDADA
jgi:hypothetical protein